MRAKAKAKKAEAEKEKGALDISFSRTTSEALCPKVVR